MNFPFRPHNSLRDVAEFHRKFQQAYNGPPRILTGDEAVFRLKTLMEETREIAEAWEEKDLAKALDAMVDLDYFLKGTVHLAGYDHVYHEAWARVHRANMTKELAGDASRSLRGYKMDVIKPPGWTPPDHSDLVKGSWG